MTALLLVAALNLSQIPTEGNDRPNYGAMTREQLVRERQRVVEARPGAGAIAFAWIATFIGTPAFLVFGGFSLLAFSEAGSTHSDAAGAKAAAPGLLVTALVGAALGALGITVIVVRGQKRNELGHELDVIDDVLDHPQPRREPGYEPPPLNEVPPMAPPPPPPMPPPEPTGP